MFRTLFAILFFLSSITTRLNAQALLMTDTPTTSDTVLQQLQHATGLTIQTFPLSTVSSSAADWKEAPVIILQTGCDERPDPYGNGPADWMKHYEQSLFDFPTGHVCTLTGKMPRHKRLAISKRQVTADDYAGRLFRLVSNIRREAPATRLFILSPQISTSPSPTGLSTSQWTIPTTENQLRLVAQMLCIPFVVDIQHDLVPYSFVWQQRRPHVGNVLILGDSYSEQKRWVRQFSELCEATIVNLGVGSATLRDRFDYHTHPYISTPRSTDNEGNHNAMACQLEKLKRLIKGDAKTDETPLPADFQPDIIFIEGGTNDHPDAGNVEAGYATAAIQADRTNFCGSLKYLCEQLRQLYPNARIYAVTPSGLYYGHTDQPFAYIQKANQIRRAAQLLHIGTVDWDREGRLTFVFNNSAGTGNGTKAHPFRYNAETAETRDLLHPNDQGARYLAETAIATLLRD